MKKIIAFILVLVVLFALCACAAPADSENKSKLQTEWVAFIGSGNIYVFTDPETKVQYFVADRGPDGGTAIIPRYNSDGTLHIED